jgi:hypothetical protein
MCSCFLIRHVTDRDQTLTEVFAFEEEVFVDAQLAAELNEIAGVFPREETAFGRTLPAPDPTLRDSLHTHRHRCKYHNDSCLLLPFGQSRQLQIWTAIH